MCHLPLSYPTAFIENCCRWLRQLLFWAWGGRTVSPCLHTHSTTVDFTMEKETTSITPTGYHSLHDCAKHSRTSNSCPLYGLFTFTQEGNSCSFSRIGLSWFYPRSFPLRIFGWCGCIFSPPAYLWALRCGYSRIGWETVISSPSRSM